MEQHTPILIVDDKPLIRDIYEHAFGDAGYRVHLAATGREALDRIDETHYGAILLDVMMPDMDGLTFLSKLADHDSASAQGPVILLTNLNPDDVARLEGEYKDHLTSSEQPVRIAGHIIKSNLTPEEIVKRVIALAETRV